MMEEPLEISVKVFEQEVNVCFEHISKTKYQLLRAREDLKHMQGEMKLAEGKVKFMRETEIPLIQEKIKNMQGALLGMEKQLKVLLKFDDKGQDPK
jgi:hypothetical protein